MKSTDLLPLIFYTVLLFASSFFYFSPTIFENWSDSHFNILAKWIQALFCVTVQHCNPAVPGGCFSCFSNLSLYWQCFLAVTVVSISSSHFTSVRLLNIWLNLTQGQNIYDLIICTCFIYRYVTALTTAASGYSYYHYGRKTVEVLNNRK